MRWKSDPGQSPTGSQPRRTGRRGAAVEAEPEARQPDYPAYLTRQLADVRGRIKKVDVATGLAVAAVGAVAYTLAMIMLDQLAVLSMGTRLGLLAIMGTATIGYMIFAVVLPGMRRINLLYAAREIERSDPSTKNSIINWILLRGRNDEVPETILKAIERRAARDLSKVDVGDAVQLHHLVRASYVLAAVIVLFCAYSFFTSKQIAPSLARVLLPMIEIAPPTETRLKDVEPGTTTIAAGEKVVISAYATGRQPQEVTLYVSSDEGQYWEPNPLDAPAEKFGRWQATLHDRQRSFDYYLTANDFQTARYRVEVTAAPMIADWKVTYTPPAYTDQPPHSEAVGDVDGLEGTKIDVEATTNVPVDPQSGRMELNLSNHQTVVNMTPVEGSDNKLTGSFVLSQEGSYRVHFADLLGRRPQVRPVKTIRSRKDLAPQVAFLEPQESQIQRPANGLLLFRVSVSDDFGLRKARFVLEHQDGEKLLVEREFGSAAAPLGKSKVLLLPVDFAPMQLKKGDVLEYWAEAQDNKQPAYNFASTRVDRRVVLITEPVDDKEREKQLEKDRQQQEQDKQQPPPDQQNPEEQKDQPQDQKPQDDQQQNQNQQNKDGGKGQDSKEQSKDQDKSQDKADQKNNSDPELKNSQDSKDDRQGNQQNKNPQNQDSKNQDSQRNGSKDGEPQDQKKDKDALDKLKDFFNKKNKDESKQEKPSEKKDDANPDQKDQQKQGANSKDAESKDQPESKDDAKQKPSDKQQEKGSKSKSAQGDDEGAGDENQRKNDAPSQKQTEKSAPDEQGADNQKQPQAEDSTNPAPGDKKSEAKKKAKPREKADPSKDEKDSQKSAQSKGDKENNSQEKQSKQKDEATKDSSKSTDDRQEKKAAQRDDPKTGEQKKSEKEKQADGKSGASKADDKSMEKAPSDKADDASSKQQEKADSKDQQEKSAEKKQSKSGSSDKKTAEKKEPSDARDPRKEAQKKQSDETSSEEKSQQRKADDQQDQEKKQSKDGEQSKTQEKQQGEKPQDAKPQDGDEKKESRKESGSDEKKAAEKKEGADEKAAEKKEGAGQEKAKSDQAKEKKNGGQEKKPSDQTSKKKDGDSSNKQQSKKSDQQKKSSSDSQSKKHEDQKKDGEKSDQKQSNSKENSDKQDASKQDQQKPSGDKSSEKKQDGEKNSSSSKEGSKDSQKKDKSEDSKKSKSDSDEKEGDAGEGKQNSKDGKPGEKPSKGGAGGGGGNQAPSDGEPPPKDAKSRDDEPVEKKEGIDNTGEKPDESDKQKASNLVLKKLQDQLKNKKVDPELLKEMGWTEADARRFADRMKNQNKPAEKVDDPMLRQKDFGRDGQLRKSVGRAAGGLPQDQLRGLEQSRRSAPPPEYRAQYEAYTRSLSRGANNSPPPTPKQK